MPNIPSAVSSVIKSRNVKPIPKIGESINTDINDLKKDVKYFYQKFNNLGIIDNYVGIFIQQKPDKNNENRPIYFFREVYYIDNFGKFPHGEKHYPSGQYPFNFIEVPMNQQNSISGISSVIGTKYVGPAMEKRLGGGKLRKSKNRKTKNYRRRGTRKH
jgi:hypothetical protein